MIRQVVVAVAVLALAGCRGAGADDQADWDALRPVEARNGIVEVGPLDAGLGLCVTPVRLERSCTAVLPQVGTISSIDYSDGQRFVVVVDPAARPPDASSTFAEIGDGLAVVVVDAEGSPCVLVDPGPPAEYLVVDVGNGGTATGRSVDACE